MGKKMIFKIYSIFKTWSIISQIGSVSQKDFTMLAMEVAPIYV